LTSLRVELARLAASMRAEVADLPEADLTAAPGTIDELAALLTEATRAGLKVLVWGGGSHQGYGARVEPDLVLVTTRLNRTLAWEPEDLTVVVEGGTTLAELDQTLSDKRLTAVMPELPHTATVGGTIAVGASGYRRLRYGPTRERLLEVTLVTGDGRIVRGGGRVVKNVTGYDLPRLAVGSLGALGVIASVCLKLWPQPPATATVTVDDLERAEALVYRPLAILSDPSRSRVYLGGSEAEVEAQIDRLESQVEVGHHWPVAPPGTVRVSLRLPPAHVQAGVARLPATWSFVAQHGVGIIEVGADSDEGVSHLRSWAESVGGALVLVAAPASVYDEFDPWGSPPATVELQRQLVAAFDPARVLNPGRLPGGI
jgi:glycolate oxidase FAD binding subunit